MKINLPFSYQLRIYSSRLEKRVGICSKVFKEDDKHILLWDFDNVRLSKIIKSLTAKQIQYKLPTIYIITSSPKRFHAYCFASRTFREVINIISGTPEIDIKYLRLGMVRGYYTLRISSRTNDDFILIKTLSTSVMDEVNPPDISINDYLTINKGGHNA